MLRIKRQRKHISNIKKEAVGQLRKIAGSSPAEHLHHFRVAVKKLKSFVAFLNPPKIKKYIKPVKKIFRESGILRDTHNANLIEEDHFTLSPVIKNKRQREFNAACQKFASHVVDRKKCFAKTWKHIDKKIATVSVHAIENYCKKELVQIPKCLSKKNGELIHAGRKRLKNVLYLYHMLSGSLQKKLNIRIDYIDKLQDAIGKWHDLVLAEPILSKRINATQMVIIRREKENLLEEVRKMSDHFWEKVNILPETILQQAE